VFFVKRIYILIKVGESNYYDRHWRREAFFLLQCSTVNKQCNLLFQNLIWKS